jgi:hypothetical protein
MIAEGRPPKKSPIIVTRKFSGKPEDIWRLTEVQNRLLQIGADKATMKRGGK